VTPTRLTGWLAALFLAAAATAPRPSWARGHKSDARTGKLVPALAELVKARKQGDHSALGRVGDRLGPARLLAAIAGAEEHVAEAAIVAAPDTRAGYLLVGAIADQLGGVDARARLAAESLGRLLDGSRPTALEQWEVPPDEIGRACSGLHALAGHPQTALETRLRALDGSLEAVPTCGVPRELASWVRDAAPEVRRAAVLLAEQIGNPGSDRAAILKQAMGDADQRVSAAAVAADCRVESRAGERKEAPPDPAAVSAARTLALAPTTAAADAVEMLDCLAAAATPADRALLDQLRRGPASPLRDRAVELTAPGQGKGN
jgi:hypothetical protein